MVRVWIDKPGSAKRPDPPRPPRRSRHRLRGRGADRDQQAGRRADRPARAQARRAVGLRPGRALPAPVRPAAAARRAPDRSGHVRAGGVREGCSRRRSGSRRSSSAASRSASTGRSSTAIPTRPSGTWRDRLVWDTKALIQKETHPQGSAGHRRDQPLRDARNVRRRQPDRSAPRDRTAESDPDPGAAARPHAGRRRALHLRARDAPADCLRPPRAARASAGLPASDRRSPADVRGRPATRFRGSTHAFAAKVRRVAIGATGSTGSGVRQVRVLWFCGSTGSMSLLAPTLIDEPPNP